MWGGCTKSSLCIRIWSVDSEPVVIEATVGSCNSGGTVFPVLPGLVSGRVYGRSSTSRPGMGRSQQRRIRPGGKVQIRGDQGCRPTRCHGLIECGKEAAGRGRGWKPEETDERRKTWSLARWRLAQRCAVSSCRGRQRIDNELITMVEKERARRGRVMYGGVRSTVQAVALGRRQAGESCGCLHQRCTFLFPFLFLFPPLFSLSSCLLPPIRPLFPAPPSAALWARW